MKAIPDYILDEMIAVTRAIREPPGSIKRANAERRAARLHKKLLKLKENDSRRSVLGHL